MALFKPPVSAAAAALLLLSPSISIAASAELTESPGPRFPNWDTSVNLRTWTGYKDNVLLASDNIETSPFVGAGFDLMIFRLPVDGTEFYLFATGDYSHFLTARQIDYEATAIVQSRLKRDWGDHWQVSATAQYLYYDQVFDVSATEREFTTLKLQAHNFGFRPALRRELGPFWLELEMEFDRQKFVEFLDDYSELGPNLTFGWNYGHRSQLSLTYDFDQRLYDTRPARDRAGQAIPDRVLEFSLHQVRLDWRHHWDEKRRWRTASRLAVERNIDNGLGFFDYIRYRFNQQLRYRADTWEIRADARLSHFDYDHQPVILNDPSTRHKTILSLGLRGERTLYKTLKGFARYEHDRSISNLALDEYSANTVWLGVDWEF